MGEYSCMERQVDISFAHNGGSAVSLSSNAYGRFGHLSASNDNDDGHKMANACNVCGWVKGVTATMGILAIFGQTLYCEDRFRAVIDENGTLEEINHYSPNGGLMGAGAMGV